MSKSIRSKFWRMLFRWNADDRAGIPVDMAQRVDELCALSPTDEETAALAAELQQREAPTVAAFMRLRSLAFWRRRDKGHRD